MGCKFCNKKLKIYEELELETCEDCLSFTDLCCECGVNYRIEELYDVVCQRCAEGEEEELK